MPFCVFADCSSGGVCHSLAGGDGGSQPQRGSSRIQHAPAWSGRRAVPAVAGAAHHCECVCVCVHLCERVLVQQITVSVGVCVCVCTCVNVRWCSKSLWVWVWVCACTYAGVCKMSDCMCTCVIVCVCIFQDVWGRVLVSVSVFTCARNDTWVLFACVYLCKCVWVHVRLQLFVCVCCS